MLKTSWETAETGLPPRHMYKLTKDGLRYAREMVSVARELATGEPAFDGVVGL
jgi:DNA-binding PadR family transcriptional regulator